MDTWSCQDASGFPFARGGNTFPICGQPLIFPVTYGLSNRIITFRTAHGTKLSYAPGSNVAFEVDDYQASTGVGWSVVVQGVGVDATTVLDDVSWFARGASPRPVAPGDDAQNSAKRCWRGRRWCAERAA
jgi:hypothetical protein